MCGLTGLFRFDSGAVDAGLLRRMTDSLAHRGPDGDGFHIEPGVGFGHRRLAIVDVGGGQQPMYNEDSSVVIVFNGEIYNFPDLRPKLQALGHVFRNRCDTEAIIHAWESYGPDCLTHLDGMFAFALWDRNRRQLFLARDRLGKKPLHYAATQHGFAFASELRAFAQLPGLSRKIDARAVDDFFAFGYVPDAATIFMDVKKLPAASYLLLEAGAARLPEPVRYWRPNLAPTRIAEAEAAESLRQQLREATRARLMSDVPLGAFLSGGVDSAAVVANAALLRAEAGHPGLDSFTIAFAGDEDETPFARMVADRYATTQHNQTAAAIDWIAASRTQGRMYGEPFGDSSAVPTDVVCALARRHATVALSGDGGDEVFAGYRRYRWHRLAEGVRRYVPGGARRAVLGRLAGVYPKLDRAPRWLRAKHTLTELSLDSALGYYRTVAKVHHDRRRALFSPSLEAALDGHDPHARIAALMEDSGSDDPLIQAQYARWTAPAWPTRWRCAHRCSTTGWWSGAFRCPRR
jgi:asparagine synthase (glutamine-hydrolysing)